jgi:hypothetical protein
MGKMIFLSTQATAITELRLYNYAIFTKSQQMSTFPEIRRKLAVIRAHMVTKVN